MFKYGLSNNCYCQKTIVGYTSTSSTRNIIITRRTHSRDVHVPFSTSALMLIVRNRSSSFSYSIPLDALLSSVRFGLRVASRRRDRNMDDVPAGGTIPPPSKPNTTSANLTLLPQLGRPSRCNCNSCTAAGLNTPCRYYTSYYNNIYYYIGHVRDVFWCGASWVYSNVLPHRRL